MSNGLRKITQGIMKQVATIDYNRIVAICNELTKDVVIPKGKTAWKIEDATAKMVKEIPESQCPLLEKGRSYYLSILPKEKEGEK